MGSLADFDGQSANGTWTLEITDNWTQDQGTLKHWSLEVSAAETRVETDADGGFAIVGLTDGDYRVRAVASEDRSLSLPSGGYYDVSLAGGAVVRDGGLRPGVHRRRRTWARSISWKSAGSNSPRATTGTPARLPATDG